jgi:hypothetical protein
MSKNLSPSHLILGEEGTRRRARRDRCLYWFNLKQVSGGEAGENIAEHDMTYVYY